MSETMVRGTAKVTENGGHTWTKGIAIDFWLDTWGFRGYRVNKSRTKENVWNVTRLDGSKFKVTFFPGVS